MIRTGVVGQKASGTLALASSVLVCVVLGSVHAFSVFLEPLELAFGLNRATVSLTYSFALVALTLAVLLGPRFYTALSPARLFFIVGIIGAIGAILAGFAKGIFGIWLGYSFCFGVANGLGYGFALQYAAKANPSRPGAAMGVVTAAYALGAAISPIMLVTILGSRDFLAAMIALAIALLLASVCAGWFAARTGVVYANTAEIEEAMQPSGFVVTRIWFAYGTSVAAGLMVIGHAAGIADLAGITPWLAPAVLAICNLFGSLAGGYLVDRYSHRKILSALPLISASGLVILALYPPLTLLALGLLGFTYGGTIAAYPAAIANRFPGKVGPRVYGLVFTAWGTAGLVAPWTAGFLFDQSQTYSSSLLIAAVLALLSAALAGRIARW